jgi:sugar lactone lactonase YvrE
MKHGGPLLPDALRWLWRDWAAPIAKPLKSFAARFVDPAIDWEPVSRGHIIAGCPAVDDAGNICFPDAPANRIFRIDHATGRPSVFRENTGGASALMFGPGARLIALQPGRRRIVAWDASGGESVLAENVQATRLAVAPSGFVYYTDAQAGRVWGFSPNGEKHILHEGISTPNGIHLSPDASLLLVTDSRTRWIWSFQVQKDGRLAHALAFHRLEIEDESGEGLTESGAAGLTVDNEGFLYVATRLGLQISDPAGRTSAVLHNPGGQPLTGAAFGGPNLDTLYVSAGSAVYRRPTKRRGVFPWLPAKPPVPRL